MSTKNPDAPVITGPVFRITCQATCNDQEVETSFDYMASTGSLGPLNTYMDALLTAWQAVVLDPLRGCSADTAHFHTYLCACLSDNHVATRFVSAFGTNGVEAGGNLPLEVAATVNKYSDLKGTHGRGRVRPFALPIGFITPTGDPGRINVLGFARLFTLASAARQTLTPIVGLSPAVPVIVTRPPVGTFTVSRAQPTGRWLPGVVLGTARRRKTGRGA